jgi:hypothetical protein
MLLQRLKRQSLIRYALSVLLSSIAVVNAQEHLVPVPDSFGLRNEYHEKLRTLFQEGFTSDVVLRVLILESFSTESLVGIRKTAEGFEAFGLRAKTSIGDTELLKEYEQGHIFLLDRDGNRTPGIETKQYQELKDRTPADFRDIAVDRMQRPLEKQTVDQITDIWKTFLQGTRYPQRPREGKDGTNYYFAMQGNLGLTMSGMVWSPNESTRTDQLVQLAETLKEYVKFKKTEYQLNAMVRTTQFRLEK